MHPPPATARTVTVGVERLARWIDGFTGRHGATRAQLAPDADEVLLTGADGARAWIAVPFAPLAAGSEDPVAALLAHAGRPRCVGVVLVRRGGHAAGLFDGAELVASKVGS